MLTKDDFDNLLRWLSVNGGKAENKYEEIRNGLIRFFRLRNCADPLVLADETLNRVAAKIPRKKEQRDAFSVKFIYGFAVNVHHEYIRTIAEREVQLDEKLPFAAAGTDESSAAKNNNIECLENCLAKLAPDESRMILKYYSENSSYRFELRKNMAESMTISTGTLHTKVHRLKNTLKKCIEECVSKKNL